MTYRVVQPWGPDRVRQATFLSEHRTAAEAFVYIDQQAETMARTGAPSDAVEMIVIDGDDRIVARPGAH